MIFLDNLINGLSLGSIYAIIALGYTMVYGIAKMLNFAHGDVIMVGAYIAFCGLQYWGIPPVLAFLLAMLVCTSLAIIGTTQNTNANEITASSLGLRIVAIVAVVFCVLGAVVLALYNEKKVTKIITEKKAE